MVTKSLTKEQQKYCLHQCEYGRQKPQELLQVCDSVFDAIEDMQSFVEECWQNGCKKCENKMLN